jgi:hypothetical protein
MEVLEAHSALAKGSCSDKRLETSPLKSADSMRRGARRPSQGACSDKSKVARSYGCNNAEENNSVSRRLCS